MILFLLQITQSEISSSFGSDIIFTILACHHCVHNTALQARDFHLWDVPSPNSSISSNGFYNTYYSPQTAVLALSSQDHKEIHLIFEAMAGPECHQKGHPTDRNFPSVLPKAANGKTHSATCWVDN